MPVSLAFSRSEGDEGSQFSNRSLLVGAFYHALPASPSVAQVAWHPWGDNSSSLLVLTVDATLREYSIGYDAEEPAQTVDLRPSESRGRGGFSSDDAGEGTAVAFCLGEGKGDWRPLTLYALMRSGDIVAVCPFLPKKASVALFTHCRSRVADPTLSRRAVPSSYIHALSVFVSTKIESPTPSDLDNSLSLALSTTSNHSPIVAQSPNAALQLKYVNSLVHQATLAHSNPPTDVEDPHLVRIVAPRLVGHPHPTRQGPFLLQPAPAELNNGHESLACDLAYISYPAPGTPGLGVFAVSYSDGKVDVCLAVNKVEARWGDAPHEREELPALAVYETIDLGLAEEDQEAVGDLSLEDNYPTFAKDPLYPDTLYVYHALGAHCLLMAKWLDDLVDLTTSDTDDEKRLAEAAHNFRAQTTTTVRWILKTASVDGEVGYPVVGLSPLNDIYLGYSILLLTSALQLVGIDLPLRVDASLLPSTTSSSSTPLPSRRGVSSDPPAYLSLLDAPFPSLPALEPRSSPLLPRLALKPPPNSSSHSTQGQPPEVIITPATLRFMGKAVETFRHEIRDLVAAADTVQCRLELQLRERKRQLAKLLELAQLSDGLRRSTGGREGLGGRLERVAQAQEALLGRMDRVLQRLMNAHQPVLSTYETRWFAELERLEKEVVAGGGGGGGEGTVEMRLERAVAQFESLRPALEDLKRKEEGKGAVNGARTNGVKAAESPATLGATQMHRLEAKLDEE